MLFFLLKKKNRRRKEREGLVGVCTVLNKVVRGGLNEKVTFELKIKRGEGLGGWPRG